MNLFSASGDFESEYCRLTGLYYDAMGLAQNGGGISSEFFNDGSSSVEVQVCFVAGTPVLLADGTSKPIEKILVGDLVLAVDHEHPDSDPQPCRVVRVFHNAPQPTWKLTLDDGQTIQCTKEHPFHVVGHGWTPAEMLKIGDQLRRPDGSTITLSTKEYIESEASVFNFEVENAHTYFVGNSHKNAVLVHNACSYDEAMDAIRNAQRIYNELMRLKSSGADDAVLQAKYNEYLNARLKATKMSNEYIASIGFWTSVFTDNLTDVNDAEKRLPVRLVEFEQQKKPENVQNYMDEMKKETADAIDTLKQLDEHIEFCTPFAVAGCVVAAPAMVAAAPFAWKFAILPAAKFTGFTTAIGAIEGTLGLGIAGTFLAIGHVAESGHYKAREVRPEELRKIDDALALIRRTPGYGEAYIPSCIQIADIKDAWGLCPNFGGGIYLNKKTLDLPTEYLASTIVHEMVHRKDWPIIRGLRETDPYQEQSNFLLAIGIGGRAGILSNGTTSAYLKDLQECFTEKFCIRIPAVY